MSHDPLHPARPQVPNPGAKPGQVPPPADPLPGQADATSPADGLPHSPKREGDNAGGEATRSGGGSNDKGHQRAPRPGDHQGGH